MLTDSPGGKETTAPGSTVRSTPSHSRTTGVSARPSPGVEFQKAMSSTPPPRLMMSSIFLKWKCVGVTWPGCTMRIFSAYVLPAGSASPATVPLRTVKRKSPIRGKSPLPKSVMSHPSCPDTIPRDSGPRFVQSSGDHHANGGSRKRMRRRNSLPSRMMRLISDRFIPAPVPPTVAHRGPAVNNPAAQVYAVRRT